MASKVLLAAPHSLIGNMMMIMMMMMMMMSTTFGNCTGNFQPRWQVPSR
jgi:hypothetical protein